MVQGSLAAGGQGGPQDESTPGSPPSAWAGRSAAYQLQDSMTQSRSDLLPSLASSTPAPPLDPVSASSLSGWDHARPRITVDCLESWSPASPSVAVVSPESTLVSRLAAGDPHIEGGQWPVVPDP